MRTEKVALGGCFTILSSNITFNRGNIVIRLTIRHVLIKYVRSAVQALVLLKKFSAPPGKLTQIQGGPNTLKILQASSIITHWKFFWYLASFKLQNIYLELASIICT